MAKFDEKNTRLIDDTYTHTRKTKEHMHIIRLIFFGEKNT